MTNDNCPHRYGCDDYRYGHCDGCNLAKGKVKMTNIEYKAYNEGFKDGVEQGIKLSQGLKGEWKLIERGNFIDIVCPYCNNVRFPQYAHGFSIEEVESQLQEANDLPNYCENCGAKLGKGGAE